MILRDGANESRKEATTAGAHLTGRERIPRNLLFSWGGYMVFVVAGFILPRYIDHQIGQTALGVWDFGWSVVGYFGLAQFGIDSSVNRFVAKYRAENDVEGLNRTASSVMCVQMLVAIVVLMLTILATWSVPGLLSGQLGAFISDARWVVSLLGLGLALQIAFNTFGGIITGCHRWDLYYALNAGFYGLTVVAMLVALASGGGLRTLAATYVCGVACTEIARVGVARLACPELRIRWRYAERSEARRLFSFGGKVFVGHLSGRLFYQTSSILVATYLGLASLALYSRPMALIQHVMTFVSKLAFMLTPIASHMVAVGLRDELRGLLFRSARYSAFMAIPPVLFLAILGGPVLGLWMGRNYEQPLVLAILAIGHLVTITHRPLGNILVGVDAYGYAALAALLAGIASAGLGFVILGPMHGELIGAAISVVLPLCIVDGVFLPVYTCRILNVSLARYAVNVWPQPVLCAIPFAVCLVIARLLFAPTLALAFAGAVGGLVLAITYWRWVLPESLRRDIKRVGGRVGWARATVPSQHTK